MSRQTESELVTPPKCSLGLNGYSLEGTVDHPAQFPENIKQKLIQKLVKAVLR